MTGRYLVPFCKKLFFISAPTYPFRQLRWHFSQGKASHSLLQRRFAPRKAVHLPSLFPVLFYSYIPDRFLWPFENDRQVFNTVKKQNPPLPILITSVLFPCFRTLFLPLFKNGGQYLIPFCKKNAIHSCRHSWAAGRTEMIIEEKT